MRPTAPEIQMAWRWQQHSLATRPGSPFHIQVSRCTLARLLTLTSFSPVSEYHNEQGETRAQEVAAEYARRNTDEIPPVPPLPLSDASGTHQQDLRPGNRISTATHSVDALTYIDEDFNYYPSKRQHDSPTDHPTAPLVANAAGRQDLGLLSPFLISLPVLIPL